MHKPIEHPVPPSMKLAREIMCDVCIICPICKENAGKWRGDLAAHLFAIHGIPLIEAASRAKNTGVTCPLCPKTFEWKGEVSLHISDEHTRYEAVEYVLAKIKQNPAEYLDPF